MTDKLTSYIPVWNKYLPAIRILLKKSAAGEQTLGMNRTDFDNAAGLRKSGYRFSLNFVDNQTDSLYSGNAFVQSFLSVLQTDQAIRNLLFNNNYTLIFTSKYLLQIKHNGPTTYAEQTAAEEELVTN